MILDIKQVKVYVISPGVGKYKERLHMVFGRLVDEGFSHIEFVRSLPGGNQTSSLTNTVLHIFEEEMRNTHPFIIVEDDCAIFHTHDQIHVPDDMDVCYLGVSLWSYPYTVETLSLSHRPPIVHISRYTVSPINDQIVQLKGMTGTHAILYHSRSFMREFINHMKELHYSVPHDLVFSSMHMSFQVYALRNPMFYQDGELGGQETVTKIQYDGVSFQYT